MRDFFDYIGAEPMWKPPAGFNPGARVWELTTIDECKEKIEEIIKEEMDHLASLSKELACLRR